MKAKVKEALARFKTAGRGVAEWFQDGRSFEMPADMIKMIIGIVLGLGVGYVVVNKVFGVAGSEMQTFGGLDTSGQSNPFENFSGLTGSGGSSL